MSDQPSLNSKLKSNETLHAATETHHVIDEHGNVSMPENVRVDQAHEIAAESAAAESTASTNRPDEKEILTQASQMAQLLNRRLEDINRREQTLHTQISAFDTEQRQFRLWKQQQESELIHRDEELLVQESRVQQNLADCQRLAVQIEQKNPELVELMTSGINIDKDRITDSTAGLQGMIDLAAAWDYERREANASARILKFERDQFKQIAESDEVQEQLALLEKNNQEITKQKKMLRKQEHFQKSHLEKLRSDLDDNKTHLHKDVQQWKVSLHHEQSMLSLRRNQLDQFRNQLQEREDSLMRERHLIDEKRKQANDAIQRGQETLAQEKEFFQQEKQWKLAEMERYQSELEERFEVVKQKQAQFLHVKKDLESAHRQTMIMREAIEKTWAELADVDPQEAKKRVEDIQEELNNLHEDRLEQSENELQKWIEFESSLEHRAGSRQEKYEKAFNDLAHQMDQLREKEDEIHQTITEFDQERKSEEAQREKWLIEKFQAEKIIRGLLDQIAKNSRAA